MKYVILIGLLLSSHAFSAISVTGKVSRIYPADSEGGKVYFKISTPHCPMTDYLYFHLNTEVGKAWYALLLAAATTQAIVNVSVNECPTNQSQQIRYIYQDFGG